MFGPFIYKLGLTLGQVDLSEARLGLQVGHSLAFLDAPWSTPLFAGTFVNS